MDTGIVCVDESAGISPDDALKTPKSAAWKIEAARALRQSTTLDSRPSCDGAPEQSVQLDPRQSVNYRTDPFFSGPEG
jgi:hypothetical protein